MPTLSGSSGVPGYVAQSTVHVMRVVNGAPVAGPSGPVSPGFVGVQEAADDTTEPYGISGEGSFYTPGLGTNDPTIHAPAGFGVKVYGRGETCMAIANAAITSGQRLIAVTNVTGGFVTPLVTPVAGKWTVGRALSDAVGAGQPVRVYVDPMQEQ